MGIQTKFMFQCVFAVVSNFHNAEHVASWDLSTDCFTLGRGAAAENALSPIRMFFNLVLRMRVCVTVADSSRFWKKVGDTVFPCPRPLVTGIEW